MKVLVCPHQLVMGGSQLNAIELAAAVQQNGHEVAVYAPTGLLAERVSELGLEGIPSPDGSRGLSRTWMVGLDRIVRRRRIDLVHVYEWAPALEAAFSVHLLRRTRMVMTVLSMDVPGFLPTHVPLIVGTAALAEGERKRRTNVHLMEPPIDTRTNSSRDAAAARTRWGFSSSDVVVVIVCRLTPELEKLQGVLAAIEVVDALAGSRPVKLLIAGDGEGYDQVRASAANVNARHRAKIVRVVGNQIDPSSAYDAADIVLGMGSSVLKGMAFSKPVIVQGAGGFWRLLTSDTVDGFRREGFYGAEGAGAADLRAALVALVEDADTREELGRFGRKLVEQHFSLDKAAEDLAAIYQEAIAGPPSAGRTILGLGTSAARYGKFRAGQWWQQLGRGSSCLRQGGAPTCQGEAQT